MITDILTYVGAYDNIRAITGLNNQELPDTDLALILYRNHLDAALTNMYGVYTGSTAEEDLVEIFDRVDDTDAIYGLIQLYSIYIVADKVMDSAGLRSYKTIADGKATLTRFSPESTYQGVRAAILSALGGVMTRIYELFGDTIEEASLLQVVSPSIDLVVGEEQS